MLKFKQLPPKEESLVADPATCAWFMHYIYRKYELFMRRLQLTNVGVGINYDRHMLDGYISFRQQMLDEMAQKGIPQDTHANGIATFLEALTARIMHYQIRIAEAEDAEAARRRMLSNAADERNGKNGIWSKFLGFFERIFS